MSDDINDVWEEEPGEDSAEQESTDIAEVEGTELENFDSADIEVIQDLSDEQVDSIVESLLFASDKPISIFSIKASFKGTNVRSERIRRSLQKMQTLLAGAERGVDLIEVSGGWQLRTKAENAKFLTRNLKTKSFKLSGPALEVLSIVAYKQPVIKSEIDSIRGVESGHLLRALMDKNLVQFDGRSDLPGKPMNYGTSKKFLEIFGLRNVHELPTLSQIEELIPEGLIEDTSQKPQLDTVASELDKGHLITKFSEGEEELEEIVTQLTGIETKSEYFEQEKLRIKQQEMAEKAQSIREAILVGEEVAEKDRRWLIRYDEQLLGGTVDSAVPPELS
jgi:segregation and condensation protein B